MIRGDPITIVHADHTVLCEVTKNDAVFEAHGSIYLAADEGRLWIRGYHTPDSKEVEAVRTVQALGEEKTKPLAGFGSNFHRW